METVRLASMAMATRFELVVRGEEDVAWLRAAGEEALAEIERFDRRLSFYAPASEISRINRTAYYEAVSVDAGLFRLLTIARDLHRQTLGTFDPTVGPLMRCWGFAGGRGRVPNEAELSRVMSRVGFHHVHLDEAARTVRFDVEGVELDLGGIAKGYAIDEAMLILAETGVKHAFMHGGTSSMRAMGDDVDQSGWRVAVAAPSGSDRSGTGGDILATLTLQDCALAVSDIRGKWFETDQGVVGHIVDPRSGRPVTGAALAAVSCTSATEADALSTALLVAGDTEREAILRRVSAARVLLAARSDDAAPRILRSDFDA